MHSLHLTLLYCALNFFSDNTPLDQPSSPAKKTNCATAGSVEVVAKNIILKSNDGGQTWQDISYGLPEQVQPDGFFAGSSDLYLRFGKNMYRSSSNINAPVWEKENALDPRCTGIAFNSSAVIAYNDGGQIYQKMHAMGTWLPTYTNFKNKSVETIFVTSDGTVFLGCRNGLYKSSDKGQNWKQVHNEGWVMDLVESDGVVIAAGQSGIMRSADNGEHWEWVIREGGVGIDVECINGGFAAISFNTTTNSRRIKISRDGGKNWKAIDEGLRPSMSISSIKQVDKYLICGHPDGIFRSADMGKTWTMVHPTIGITFNLDNKDVFKIYTSGNVLYAIASSSGC